MDNAVAAAGMVGAAHDFSMWGLFMQADFIVKSVMIMLFGLSIWCWAIIIEKFLRLRRLNGAATKFEDNFWSGGSLDTLYDKIGGTPQEPMSAVFGAAMREWRRTRDIGGTMSERSGSLMQRIDRVMDVTVNREMTRVERQMTVLASTAATAPFIGLFGTVWGIMNSFGHIAQSKNTSLAVVAPGISEALFATAIGLVAAIPAAGAYNILSGQVQRYSHQLEAFAGEFITILSRQLEEQV